MDMKRWLLSVCLLCSIICSSCQPNPEQDVVIGKAEAQLEEIIHETKESAPREEVLTEENLPSEGILKPMHTENYQDTYPGAEESVTITINAEVRRPEGDLPVLRVTPGTFTSEDVQTWTGALFEGNTAYAPLTVMKKSEVEEKILEIRQILGDEEALWANASDRDDYEEIKAHWQEELAAYEKAYESAPENVQTQVTDWQFHPREYYDGAGIDGQMTCMVTTKIENKKVDLIVNNCQIDDLNTHNLWYSFDNGYEAGELQMTESEAEQVVRTVLEQTGYSHYTVKQCLKTENEYRAYYEMVVLPTYEGVETLYVGNVVASDNTDSHSAFTPYEMMCLQVSNGRVVSIEWFNPMEVIAIENTAANILPFNEIKHRIKEQLQLEYTLGKASGYDDEWEPVAAEVRIDRITCGLARVKVPEREGEFYYFPAWGVYGETGVDYGEGIRFAEKEAETLDIPLLVLNALDGSVINVKSGY